MSTTSSTTATSIPAATRPQAPWRDWVALALLMFPVLLVAVDNTALTFALPAIARSLSASGRSRSPHAAPAAARPADARPAAPVPLPRQRRPASPRRLTASTPFFIGCALRSGR